MQTAPRAMYMPILTQFRPLALAGMLAMLTAAGCNTAPPPDNQPVPPPGSAAAYHTYYPADYPKPLPQQTVEAVPPPTFNDPVIMENHLPEETWFVDVYNHVGRPRIAMFVNRTLDGTVVGNPDIPITTIEVQTPGAPVLTSTTWLHPGQYDAAQLATLDYSLIEQEMTDWMACNGKVTMLAQDFVRAKLSGQELKDLQDGKPAAMNTLGQKVDCDVLIQVQAHPTMRDGKLAVTLVAQAINVPRDGHGGESIASAAVDMPTPVDRYAINNYTRFVVRKLIHGMVNTWTSAPAPGAQPPADQGAPPTGPMVPLPPTTQPLPTPGWQPFGPGNAPVTRPSNP